MPKIPAETDFYDKMHANDFLARARKHAKKRTKRLANILRPASKEQWWRKYSTHLKSDKWKAFKLRIIAKRGAMCERCGTSGHSVRLDLHHISYTNVGREREEDVKLLCHRCHQLMHPGKELR